MGREPTVPGSGYLKSFGSVTVLNGHIHQTMQKVEGNITFHRDVDCFPTKRVPDRLRPMKVPAKQLIFWR
jgi:hypothetical protein